MDFSNLLAGALPIVCCVVPFFIAIAIWFFIPTPGDLLSYFLNREWSKRAVQQKVVFQQEAQEYSERVNAIIENGILAPANVLSLTYLGETRRLDGMYKVLVEYDVEVLPAGQASFKAKFQYWLSYVTKYVRKNVHFEAIEMERGKKIWVAYDPNDHSQIVVSHYDTEHEVAVRRIEFNKLTKGNEALKQSGEPAEAIITRVDDLNLPYPAKKSRAMHIEFKVTPASGAGFLSSGNFLIGDSAIQKYSVGKKVYVRFDSANPENAVLDSERNRSLK